jgi:predicted anti-sigma-YlaC factor YlaD
VSVHDEVRQLLSAYLDDELTQADNQKVRIHLEDCTQCRGTLTQLERLQTAAAGTSFLRPTEEEMEKLEQRLSVQAPRKAGWVLLIVGIAVWAVYGSYLFLTDPDLLTFEGMTIGAIVIGLVLIFVSVLRQRLLELPHDRYKGVKQ